MPLKHGKSEKSFEHNVSTEMDAGKPQKQALAIAYAVRKKAMKQKKAMGGMIEAPKTMIPGAEMESEEEKKRKEEELQPAQPQQAHGSKMSGAMMAMGKAMGGMADGGMVEDEEPTRVSRIMKGGLFGTPGDIASSIRKKRMGDDELSIDENDHDERDIFLTADMPEQDTGSEHGFASLDEDAMVDEEMAEDKLKKKARSLGQLMDGLYRR